MLKPKRVIIAVLACGVAVAASASPAQTPPAQAPTDTRPGRAEYIEMGCYQCHGYEGQGARGTGPRIAPDPMDLDLFSSVLRQPPDVMPAYSPKVLSEAKVKRIHLYLLSIKPPPDVSTVKALSEN